MLRDRLQMRKYRDLGSGIFTIILPVFVAIIIGIDFLADDYRAPLSGKQTKKTRLANYQISLKIR